MLEQTMQATANTHNGYISLSLSGDNLAALRQDGLLLVASCDITMAMLLKRTSPNIIDLRVLEVRFTNKTKSLFEVLNKADCRQTD